MRLNYLFLFLVFLYTAPCFSQTISGQIRDDASNEMIPFANVGVIGKDIGTISELNGEYTLNLGKALDSDTLKFSFIGYQSVSISIRFLRENGPNYDVRLKKQTITLGAVTVVSSKLDAKVLGIPKKDCYPVPLFKKATSNLPFPQASYRHEIGTFFANDRPTYLDSIQFNFTDIQLDRVELRVNIYRHTNGQFVSVLNEPIYLSFKANEETCKLDVSHLNLQLESDFLITIENYKRIKDASFKILANFKRKGQNYPTYYRRNTQSDWIKLQAKSEDFGMSFMAFVRQ